MMELGIGATSDDALSANGTLLLSTCRSCYCFFCCLLLVAVTGFLLLLTAATAAYYYLLLVKRCSAAKT
jgi:hypothetical protein